MSEGLDIVPPAPFSWVVNTALPRETVRAMLEPFRPFRIEVSFTNGFSTRDYGDRTAYASSAPLSKLHYIGPVVGAPAGKRILDIGCHLGYYGHEFLRLGAARYVGVEIDRRIHQCAQTIRSLSGLAPGRLDLLNLDFSSRDPLPGVSDQTFDVVLCLASLNNVDDFAGCLRNLRAACGAGGVVVLEYLAIDAADAICQLTRDGYMGDRSLRWIFSETFIDHYLDTLGLKPTRKLVNWTNDAAIGPGKRKIMTAFALADSQISKAE